MHIDDLRDMSAAQLIDFLLKEEDRTMFWFTIGIMVSKLEDDADRDAWGELLYTTSFDEKNGYDKALAALQLMKEEFQT